MKVGDLVRYTPEGRIDDRWKDWYGLVVKEVTAQPAPFVQVMWSKDSSTTLSIRKKDLIVVNESR